MSRTAEQVQHTPGPWVVWDEYRGGFSIVARHFEGGGVRLCPVTIGYCDEPMDAAVMAGAPLLLDALRDLVTCVDEDGHHVLRTGSPLIERARAAIAAATTYPRGEES